MHPSPLKKRNSCAKYDSLSSARDLLTPLADIHHCYHRSPPSLDALNITDRDPDLGPKVNTVEKLAELRHAGVNIGES